jgi:hypothetical protein
MLGGDELKQATKAIASLKQIATVPANLLKTQSQHHPLR